MNKNEHKRNKELYYVSNVVRNLGFEPNKSMCADCPDIILPSATNRFRKERWCFVLQL